MSDNEFAAAKRKEKARKIADYVIREAVHGGLLVALEQLQALTDEEWKQVCADAGHETKKSPSEESRRLVIGLVQAEADKYAPKQQPGQQALVSEALNPAEYPD